MTTNLTGSRLDCAEICASSCALPGAFITETARTKKGTITHKFIEYGVKHGRDYALKWLDDMIHKDHTIPDWVWLSCSNLPLDDLIKGYDIVLNEASYNLDVSNITCKFTGEGVDRHYGKHEVWEIPATADLVLLDSTGTHMPRVVEIKTYDAGAADEHLQLAFLCAAVAVEGNHEDIEGCLVHIPPDGTPYWKTAVFSAEAIARTIGRVAKIAKRVVYARALTAEGKQPDLRRGSHCKYCAALPMCPAYITLASRLAGDPSGGIREALGEMTPERVGAAYEILTQIEGFCEVNRELIRNLVAAHPAVMPDGRSLYMSETRYEEIRYEDAYPIVVDMVGEDLAKDCLDYSMSKTRLIKVLGEREGERVLQALRGAYAVRGGMRPRLTVGKAKQDQEVKRPRKKKQPDLFEG